MSIYSDKLAHIQVVINCPYSVCTREDVLGAPCIDYVMSFNSLTTKTIKCLVKMVKRPGSKFLKVKTTILVFSWENPNEKLC